MKNNKKEMPFWDHIYELRKRLLIIIIGVIVFSIIGYLLFPYYFKIIRDTLQEDLYVTQIPEAFFTRLKSSIFTGLFLSIPIILFQIILFVFPALTSKEKILLISVLISSYILFLSGVIFSFKMVLPVSINFLKSRHFFPDNVYNLYTYNKFLQFFFQFLFGFGVCFEFPVVLLILLYLKLINIKFLLSNFKYVIVACFILSALLTPPDVVSQLLLAIPMIALYGLTIIIGLIFKLGR